jgi:hypothetical protein
MVKALAVVLMVFTAVTFGGSPADATLTIVGTDGAGNNLIYDSDLKLTWYDAPAVHRTWDEAQAWIASLNSVKLGGAGNWRLPRALPVNGTAYNYSSICTDGSTDVGYNISAPGSAYPGSTGNEMAYLYYNTLANEGDFDVDGTPNLGLTVNYGLFTNLQGFWYWSGTEYDFNSWAEDYALAFTFGPPVQSGSQYEQLKNWTRYALAVHGEETDTTPPTLAPVASQTILWPPNGKMVSITIQANASDDSGMPVQLDVAVACNESQEGVSFWTTPVIDESTGVISLSLMSGRFGKGSGRQYTITIIATDQSDNTSAASVNILVPHDQGRR